LANALGWFSLGLGLAEIVAPRAGAQWIGIRDDGDNTALMRMVGLREIATGVGILAQPRPAGWLRLRGLGDAMDLALLGAALNSKRAARDKVTKATAVVFGLAVLDLLVSQQFSQQQPTEWRNEHRPVRHRLGVRAPSVPHEQGIHVEKSITINRSPAEIYQFWRNFENLPRFMSHLKSVQVIDERRSHWVAKAPAGMSVEWDAEIIDDTPNERISWRSLEGADVPNAGSVRFKPTPGDRGTVVIVEIQYKPPGGALGAAIAKLFGEEPEQQVADDLRAFKQVMDVVEVVRSEATLAGTRSKQRPAQPPKEKEFERMLQ
jgi:uncharacterized membrane protein